MQYTKQYQQWQAGQAVQVQEWPGQYKIHNFIIYSSNFVEAHVYKLKRDGSVGPKNSSVGVEKLMTIDAEQPNTDKNGLTAKEYAGQTFSCGYAVHDYCRTTRQSLVKVLSISKAGRVKVQQLAVTNGIEAVKELRGNTLVSSQEERVIRWDRLETRPTGSPETYTPRLHNGEWVFCNGEQYIQYAGMKLTWLLD